MAIQLLRVRLISWQRNLQLVPHPEAAVKESKPALSVTVVIKRRAALIQYKHVTRWNVLSNSLEKHFFHRAFNGEKVTIIHYTANKIKNNFRNTKLAKKQERFNYFTVPLSFFFPCLPLICDQGWRSWLDDWRTSVAVSQPKKHANTLQSGQRSHAAWWLLVSAARTYWRHLPWCNSNIYMLLKQDNTHTHSHLQVYI